MLSYLSVQVVLELINDFLIRLLLLAFPNSDSRLLIVLACSLPSILLSMSSILTEGCRILRCVELGFLTSAWISTLRCTTLLSASTLTAPRALTSETRVTHGDVAVTSLAQAHSASPDIEKSIAHTLQHVSKLHGQENERVRLLQHIRDII